MNCCLISGFKVGKVLDIGKGMRFIVKTRYRSRDPKEKIGTSYVPCLVFDLDKEQREALKKSKDKQVYVELVGHLCPTFYGDKKEEDSLYAATDVISTGKEALIKKVK